MGHLTFEQAVLLTAERREAAGLFFDFDGTLSPIQDDPETVQPTPGVLQPLQRLSCAVRRVAVVSGRPVSFLQERFAGLTRVALYGLYGLEVRQPRGEVTTDPRAVPWIETIRSLADRAREELPVRIRVECKRLSVALHYREFPEQRERAEAWAAEQVDRLGLKRQDGRMVVELKPPVERDKGQVVRGLIADLRCAWFFGDDLGDIAAFDQLRERAARDADFAGIRAVVASRETGAQLADHADVLIDSPFEMPSRLRALADAL